MPIRQLATDVAAKIAAGEVVERPASVVKELIENSIDAGATQIRVDLVNGGLQLIRVIDNGSGIPAGELELALARHATSKVSVIDDLEHIRSLGFRGEALASIAAVADVTLLSRHRDAEQGAQINALNGQISEVSTAASPEGTTLTVRNLFSAVPARLKFLKSRNSEVSHCLHMLEQYALAYPEIRFSVFSEGRQIFSTAGDGQLSSVLIEIYGLQVAEQMVPISSLDGRDDEPERPVASGYISLPGCYKSTRQHISFFVNRRWVLSRMLTTALEEAYHSLLLAGRHPIAAVNISLDPTLLDVNVHPAKTEIRFLKERRVYAAVLRAVRGALLEEATMPEWGDGNRAGTGSRDAMNRAPTTPEDDSDQTFPEDNPWLTVTEEETGTKPPILSRLWQSHVSPHGTTVALTGLASPVTPSPVTPSPLTPTRGVTTFHDGTHDDESPGPLAPARDARETHDGDDDGQHVVTPLLLPLPAGNVGVRGEGATGMEGMEEEVHRLPRLRVIGQLAQSYIVAEGPDGTGMYLVDQHAAHERILLEAMVAALKARTPISQMLLTPIQLELAPKELEAIEDHLTQLEQIGFAMAILDNKVLSVQAVPNVLVKQMNARSLHELLTDLTVPENRGHTETWEEHALANVACKAAIKAHYFLTVSEMREMIEQLEQTNAPYSCCHGRPTMVHFSLSALEREFGRR